MDKNQVLYQKVIDYAKNKQAIRLVLMNGSRVNLNVEPDQYQDFDLVFFVEKFDSFIKDKSFIHEFGQILIMQTKDDQIIDTEDDHSKWYVFLTQFKDGSRLDLTILPIEDLSETIGKDSMTKVILDKDHLLEHQKEANESTYYIKRPSKKDLSMTINEFYWVCPYVGKALARNHIFYANKHLDILRKQIEKMLDWWIGYNHSFSLSVGKGKYRYIDLLPEYIYNQYKLSYADVDVEHIKRALFTSIDLFDDLHKEITQMIDMKYDGLFKDSMKDFIREQYIKK